MIYIFTLPDGTKKEYSTKEVGRRLLDAGFTRLGHNFQSRLEQFRFIEPTIVNWEMTDPFTADTDLPLEE